MSETGNPRVRLGIIGLGNMGLVHARNVLAGKTPRIELAAICDPTLPKIEPELSALAVFPESGAMSSSGAVDAVLIATPHFSHTPIGLDALENGLHVLVEKPVSVHKSECERLIAAHTNPRQVFAAVFNQRTDPYYQTIRELVRDGGLGEIRRINWTVTNWFRTEAYYASGGWRATWAGEGGGVLLNQCPHSLDLFQWIFGMPKSVRAFCSFGRYHDIEVEDDVTAYFEMPNGATAIFIASTGEAPGTNRLEVAAERGKLVYENDEIRLTRNEVPMSEFSRTSSESFAAPPTTEITFPKTGHGAQHAGILNNFAEAILDGAPLIAPAAEGIYSVELANAILYSALRGETIELPLDGAAYEEQLNRLIAGSTRRKKALKRAASEGDFAKSF